ICNFQYRYEKEVSNNNTPPTVNRTSCDRLTFEGKGRLCHDGTAEIARFQRSQLKGKWRKLKRAVEATATTSSPNFLLLSQISARRGFECPSLIKRAVRPVCKGKGSDIHVKVLERIKGLIAQSVLELKFPDLGDNLLRAVTRI
ncbi:hypothetical protein Trydic_g13386, partial [Trypoxylus dichotomus]